MTKGKLTPSFTHGFKPEYVESYKLQWLDYKRSAKQQSLQSYIVKETQKASKLRQDEMITEICNRLDKMDNPTVENTLKLIRQVVIIENKTILGRYKCRDYYDTVRARANPQTWLTSMTTLVTDKNFI
jgi:hypothetical protein